MELAIRQLLTKSEKDGDCGLLVDAFEKLKRGRKDGSDHTDPFSSDLFVICAQVSLKLNQSEIASNCMKLYFQKAPPSNEFLCHAYLCQAQLSAPIDAKEKEKLKQCVGFVLKAINYAKVNSSFNFLVFNASVLYWSFVRPFMKPNERHLIAPSLHVVVKALEEVDDEDHEWRAELTIYLLECLIDSGKKDEAEKVSQAAFDFMKSHVPHMCKQVLAMQVKYKLLDPGNIKSHIKSNSELSIYYQILILASDTSSSNLFNEASTILNVIRGEERMERSSSRLSISGTSLINQDKNVLLLELARTCLQLQLPEIAEECVASLDASEMDLKFSLEVNFLRCELMVKRLKENSESFTKRSIEVRLQAVKSLEGYLISAGRCNDGSLIQIGCVTMWNLCLPLLQNNLRKHVGPYLGLIVDMLDDIDSLLHSLRCQLHFEVAKCDEEKEQLQSAILHLIKALELDTTGSYKAQIIHKLERLKLKSVLYNTPERAEDHAAMIIEQAESSKAANSPEMMREYLMKAGILLAPEEFHLVMEAEKALFISKVGESPVEKLAEKVTRYENGIAKLDGHVERLENSDDKERVRLWADLVKTARRQKVWDVTRVAAMFCLLYDDNRWALSVECSPCKSLDSKISGNQSQPTVPNFVEFGVVSKEHLEGVEKFEENEDFLTLFAEINFIFAEALVELLMKEGYKLLENVKEPEQTKSTPIKFQKESIKTADKPEWIQYVNWLNGISKKALAGFLRSSNIGVELNQSWIVCNAGIYVWNYTHHLQSSGCYAIIKPYLYPLFKNIKIVGHTSETVFLCDLAHAIAQGSIQPFLPDDRAVRKVTTTHLTSANKNRNTKMGKLSNRNVTSKVDANLSATDLSTSSLKEAVEILEYTLGVTSGVNVKDIVPISVRYSLIKAYVLCKGLMHLPLPKNYGHDNDDKESQGPMSKALFVLEALSLQTKGIVEFQQCPNITEVMKMVEQAKWSDNLLLLQVWSQLAVLAFSLNDMKTATQCSDKALGLKRTKIMNTKKTPKKNTKVEDKYTLEQEMLYYACIIKGQCSVASMNGRSEIRKVALNSFVEACRYASLSGNKKLVMTAARHFWNTIHPIITNPFDRQMLMEPIKEVIKCIQVVSKHLNEGDDTNKDEDTEKQKIHTAPSSKRNVKKQKGSKSIVDSKSVVDKLPDRENDDNLKLRAALYGVLFQAYADKNELSEGIQAMDDAIKEMPRTHHRLLIFKHRILTNAKLDKPVVFDMGKFANESEAVRAEMWQQVAKNSVKQKDQMSAYINAIQTLNDENYIFQKVDYLSEFAEWLFVNEYEVSEAVDQLLYAISLLLNRPGISKNSGKDLNSIKEKFRGLEIRKMDILIHLYVMLACMVGPGNTLFKQCSLSAAVLVRQIWKTALSKGDYAVKSGLKPGESIPEKQKEQKSSSPDHRKLDASPSRAAGSRKSTARMKTAAKQIIPLNLESWALFTIPDNIKEHFKADSSGTYLNITSFRKPELTLFYLQSLCENLFSIGFHHLAILPVLLMGYIAEDILDNTNVRTLVHTLSCELFEKLRMKSPYQLHQKHLGCEMLSEEDIALSRQECEVWNEKQQQLTQYESSVTNHNDIGKETCHLASTQCINKQQNGFAITRHTWCLMADHLIQWGQYQSARKLLDEAKLSADAYNDKSTKELISYYMACIANKERDWGKVILLLDEAHCYPKPQLLWMNKLMILVDSVHNFSCKSTSFLSNSSNSGFEKAKKLLIDSIRMIDEMCRNMKNKTYLGPYIKARLTGKLGMISYKESEERHNISDKHELIKCAIEYTTESYHDLKRLGYVFEALQLTKLCIEMHIKFSSEKRDDEKKEALVNAYHFGKSALSDVRELIPDNLGLTFLDDIGEIILPIQQEMHFLQIAIAEVMKLMMDIALSEKNEKAKLEENKKLINRVIDNYVDIQEELTPFQVKWQDRINLICQDIIVMCISMNCLKKDFPEDFFRSSLHMGSLLNTVSRYDMANQLDSWDTCDMKPDHNSDFQEGYNEESRVSEDKLADESDKLPFCNTEEKVIKFQRYNFFTSQAVEHLLHAVQNGLQYSCNDILLSASQQLVEIIGKRDQTLAINLLALYQSVDSSNFLRKTVKQALNDSHQSASAALLMQNEMLRESCTSFNSNVESNVAALDGCPWWRRLAISRNHLDLLKEIPFNVTYIILQHSSDTKYIYGGVMERGSPEGAVKKSGKSPTPLVKTCIDRKETDESTLDKLLELCKEYRALLCREFMLQAKEESEHWQKKGLVGNKDNGNEQSEDGKMKADSKKRITDLFETLMTALEVYLGSLLTSIEQTLKNSTLPEVLIILADCRLMELPLEALSIFQIEGIKSVGRDFSLQMFYNRCVQESDSEKSGNQKHGQKGKDSRQGGKPGDKSAAKKNVKPDIGGGEKKAPIDNMVVDLGNLKYLIDPFNDTSRVDHQPHDVIEEVVNAHRLKLSKWSGIKGSDGVANIKDMQELMESSDSFIFSGFGRLFSVIPPDYLITMDLSNCNFLMVLDRVQTSEIYLRQGSFDSLKSWNRLQLEYPVQTAAILSLCGVKSIVMNHWNTMLNSNNEKLHHVFNGFYEKNVSLGETVKSWSRCGSEIKVSTNLEDSINESSKKGKNAKAENGPATLNEPQVSEGTEEERLICDRFNLLLYGIPSIITS